MFEEFQEEEKEFKEQRIHRLWICAIIIIALGAIGGVLYVVLKPIPQTPLTAQSASPAAKPSEPDPARDLQVIRAVMGKDVTGVRVMWSVQVRNKSDAFSYSDLEYEARFIKPDGSTLSVSRDTIKCNIAPGDETKIPQFIDGIYDPSAATYQFKLTGARAVKQ